jgi:3'-5' exonuclease
MNYIILDIETSAKPESELKLPEFEASKVLKDPEKIKADIEKKKQDYLDEGALHAERGYVLAIGLFKKDGNTIILEGKPEAQILEDLWKIYDSSDGCFIIGHNLKGFDIPFLVRRSWLNDVKVPFGVINGRYLGNRFIDTMELWACGNYRETISLNNLALAFGLPGKTGNGKDFAKQYLKGGEEKKKALDYLKNDLMMTHSVAVGMGIAC